MPHNLYSRFSPPFSSGQEYPSLRRWGIKDVSTHSHCLKAHQPWLLSLLVSNTGTNWICTASLNHTVQQAQLHWGTATESIQTQPGETGTRQSNRHFNLRCVGCYWKRQSGSYCLPPTCSIPASSLMLTLAFRTSGAAGNPAKKKNLTKGKERKNKATSKRKSGPCLSAIFQTCVTKAFKYVIKSNPWNYNPSVLSSATQRVPERGYLKFQVRLLCLGPHTYTSCKRNNHDPCYLEVTIQPCTQNYTSS